MGVKVYCLALGGADLTSSSGTMTMQVLNAVAQFERDLLIERTQSGLRRAKSEGKTLGRPSTLSEEQKQDVREDLANELSVSAIARKFGTSRQTIMASRHESGESVRHLRTYGDHAARKEVSRRSGLRSGLSVGVQM